MGISLEEAMSSSSVSTEQAPVSSGMSLDEAMGVQPTPVVAAPAGPQLSQPSPHVGIVDAKTAEPEDKTQGMISSGLRSGVKGFVNAALDVQTAFTGRGNEWVDSSERKRMLQSVGITPSVPQPSFSENMRTDIRNMPTNPEHPIVNTIAGVVGSAAPMIGAGFLSPGLGVGTGVAQGGGSAIQEGKDRGDSESDISKIAIERGVFNGLLAFVPGGKAGGGFVKSLITGTAKAAAINALQVGVEAKLKDDLGMGGNEITALKDAAKSGDFWAQAFLFGAIHAVSSRGQQRQAEQGRGDGSRPEVTPAAPTPEPDRMAHYQEVQRNAQEYAARRLQPLADGNFVDRETGHIFDAQGNNLSTLAAERMAQQKAQTEVNGPSLQEPTPLIPKPGSLNESLGVQDNRMAPVERIPTDLSTDPVPTTNVPAKGSLNSLLGRTSDRMEPIDRSDTVPQEQASGKVVDTTGHPVVVSPEGMAYENGPAKVPAENKTNTQAPTETKTAALERTIAEAVKANESGKVEQGPVGLGEVKPLETPSVTTNDLRPEQGSGEPKREPLTKQDLSEYWTSSQSAETLSRQISQGGSGPEFHKLLMENSTNGDRLRALREKAGLDQYGPLPSYKEFAAQLKETPQQGSQVLSPRDTTILELSKKLDIGIKAGDEAGRAYKARLEQLQRENPRASYTELKLDPILKQMHDVDLHEGQLSNMDTNNKMMAELKTAIAESGDTSPNGWMDYLTRLRESAKKFHGNESGAVDLSGMIDHVLGQRQGWTTEHLAIAGDWVMDRASDLNSARKALIERFGGQIKPYIQKIWTTIQDYRAANLSNVRPPLNEGAVGNVKSVREANAERLKAAGDATEKAVLAKIRPTEVVAEKTELVGMAKEKKVVGAPETTQETADRLNVAVEKVTASNAAAAEGIKASQELTGKRKSPHGIIDRLAGALNRTPKKNAMAAGLEKGFDPFTSHDRHFGDKAPQVKKVWIDDLMHGQDRWDFSNRKSTESLTKKLAVAGMDETAIHNARTGKKELTLPSGKFEFSPAEIATVVANSSTEYNKAGLDKHGFALSRMSEKKFTGKDAEAIVTQATPQERSMAKAVMDVFEEQWPEVKAAYKRHTGKDLTERAKYYLMEYSFANRQGGVLPDFNASMKAAPEGLSLVQDITGPANPVKIRDIFDAFSDHTNKASIVKHLMEPTRAAMMLLGNPALRNELTRAHGRQAVGNPDSPTPDGIWARHIATMSHMWDGNADRGLMKFSNVIQRNAASMALWNTVSSILKQSVDMGNMTTQFTGHGKEFASGVKKSLTSLDTQYIAALDKYAGSLYERSYGNRYHLTTSATEGGTQILGRTEAGQVLGTIREGGMWLMMKADMKTGRAAWEAERLIVAKELPSLKGDAFEMEVIRRTTLDVERAQNATTPMGQSDLAKQLNRIPIVKWSMTFTGPANKTYNLIVREITRAQRGDVWTAGKNLAIIGTGMAVSATISTALGKAGWDAIVKMFKGTAQEEDKKRLVRAATLNVVRELGGPVYFVGPVLDQITMAIQGTRTQGAGSLPNTLLDNIATHTGDLIAKLNSDESYTEKGKKNNSEQLKKAVANLAQNLLDVGAIPGGSFSRQVGKFVSPFLEPVSTEVLARRMREGDKSVVGELKDRYHLGQKEPLNVNGLSQDQVQETMKRSNMQEEEWKVYHAGSVDKAIKAWEELDSAKRKKLWGILRGKIGNAEGMTMKEKVDLVNTLRSEM